MYRRYSTYALTYLQVFPLSTISAIRPKVMQGQKNVKKPERKWNACIRLIDLAYMITLYI